MLVYDVEGGLTRVGIIDHVITLGYSYLSNIMIKYNF